MDRITEDEAYSAVEEMFPWGLNTIIDSVLKSQVRKSLPPSEDDFFEEMVRIKIATLNAVRIPRGIYDETNQHKGYHRGPLPPHSKGQTLSFRDGILM